MRENACDQVAIGFSLESDWLRKWSDFFDPITLRSKAKPKQACNYFLHSIENRSSGRTLTATMYSAILQVRQMKACILILVSHSPGKNWLGLIKGLQLLKL